MKNFYIKDIDCLIPGYNAKEHGTLMSSEEMVSGLKSFDSDISGKPFDINFVKDNIGIESLSLTNKTIEFIRKNRNKEFQKGEIFALAQTQENDDLYELLNNEKEYGIGRIGYLDTKTDVSNFIEICKSKLNTPCIRYVGDLNSEIKKVALCSGSGAFLIKKAKSLGADVLVTGDLKYHDAILASSLRLNVIDAGHFPTEYIMVEEMEKVLTDEFNAQGVHLIKYEQRDPFIYI